MKTLLAVLFLLCATAIGQINTPALYPHPYVEAGLDLNGAGSSPASFGEDLGIDFESKHFIADGNFAYNSAKKSDDETNNPKGHSIGYGGTGFVRVPHNWFIGGGYSFGKLITTNYDKQAASPKIGGGKDFFFDDWSFRLQGLYFTQTHFLTTYPTPQSFTPGLGQPALSRYCSKCDNGLWGMTFGFWLPSPATDSHFFFHETVAPYFLHETVTDPYDLALTRIQKASKAHSISVAFELEYRF